MPNKLPDAFPPTPGQSHDLPPAWIIVAGVSVLGWFIPFLINHLRNNAMHMRKTLDKADLEIARLQEQMARLTEDMSKASRSIRTGELRLERMEANVAHLGEKLAEEHAITRQILTEEAQRLRLMDHHK